MKALLGATLIDGTGSPAMSDSAVLLDGDRIHAVGPRGGVEIPPGTEEVELGG